MSNIQGNNPLPVLPNIFGVDIRHIPDWTGYAVGDDGSVWSCKNPGGQKKWFPWRKLTLINDPDGYPFVNLSNGIYRWRVKICALVLIVFISPRPYKMECRHFPDRNRSNNRLDNLKWGTNSENKKDAVRDGTCSLLIWSNRYNGRKPAERS
jgi:hypothetical protein